MCPFRERLVRQSGFMSLAACFLLLHSSEASAQLDVAAQQDPRLAIVLAAGCRIVAVLTPPVADPHRAVLVENQPVQADISDPDAGGQIVATLAHALTHGRRVQLRYGNLTSPPVEVSAGESDLGCAVSDADLWQDERQVLDTPFFFGGAYEQFAPGFANPEESSDASRITAGMQGEYRLARAHPGVWTAQAWLYGGFLAGVRSYVYCTDTNNIVCDPLNLGNIRNARAVIADATSFEASLGFRFEFLSLNRGSIFPANVYVTYRTGALALDRASSEKLGDFVAAVGMVVIAGPMRGTSFQAGWGATELYKGFLNPPGTNPWNRWKVDVLIMTGAKKTLKEKLTAWDRTKDSVRFFFAVKSDFDKGQRPDSVRVAIGFTFAPSAFFSAGGGALTGN